MLADGRLSLCTVCTLEPCLGEVDADELIALAVPKTKRQVEELVNERIGKPAPKRDSIRRVGPEPEAKPVRSGLRLGGSLGLRLGEPEGVESFTAAAPAQAECLALASPAAAPQPQAARVDAFAQAMSHRISFSTRAAVAAKLRRLEELLGTTSLDEVIEKAADALWTKSIRSGARPVGKSPRLPRRLSPQQTYWLPRISSLPAAVAHRRLLRMRSSYATASSVATSNDTPPTQLTSVESPSGIRGGRPEP